MDESPVFSIPRRLVVAMVEHCRLEAPLEACGLLAGADGLVTSWDPLTNVARSETRYDADPVELIEVFRRYRETGIDVLAIYHSHPRWPATPSKTDLRENHYQDLPRVIVSLENPIPDVKVWRFQRDSYLPLAWSVIEP